MFLQFCLSDDEQLTCMDTALGVEAGLPDQAVNKAGSIRRPEAGLPIGKPPAVSASEAEDKDKEDEFGVLNQVRLNFEQYRHSFFSLTHPPLMWV